MLSLKMKLICAILLFLLPATVCAQSGSPVLQAGTVNISGNVAIPETLKKDSVWLWLMIPQPFTGENKIYKTLLDPNGCYALEIATQSDLSRCAVSTDIDKNNQVTVLLKSGRKNKISFAYSNDGIINKVESNYNSGFTEDELIQSLNKFKEMIVYKTGSPAKPLYNKPFRNFIDHLNSVLQKKQTVLNHPPFLSDEMKEIVFRDYSLAEYYMSVFNYHAYMVINYKNANNRKMPDSSEIKEPVRQDYTFLKDLDLNNQLYLYCFSYPTFTQELLKNSAINLPRIQDTPIREWTENVRDILGYLIGFDQGIFYDMLVGNAYALQFETELKPLTSKQIENIQNYYKGGDLEKILLRKNEEIIRQARFKKTLVINSTPDVSPEELMNAIISRYKGKAVVVDFWATWCVPCLEALKESRDLKKQLVDKDVMFIYITNTSSPKKLWERDIRGIGGEQYYLTTKDWRYVSDSFNFSAIPSYMIFDKNGILKQKFTGYPGNEAMQKRIEAVLKDK